VNETASDLEITAPASDELLMVSVRLTTCRENHTSPEGSDKEQNRAISAGCIRMTNEDAIDLYNRAGKLALRLNPLESVSHES
jgi:hypothetical protein